eukprot:g56778.t1
MSSMDGIEVPKTQDNRRGVSSMSRWSQGNQSVQKNGPSPEQQPFHSSLDVYAKMYVHTPKTVLEATKVYTRSKVLPHSESRFVDFKNQSVIVPFPDLTQAQMDSPSTYLKLKLLDRDLMATDDFIGSGKIKLSEYVKQPGVESKELVLVLKNSEAPTANHFAGKVRLTLTYVVYAPETEDALPKQKLVVKLISAHNLFDCNMPRPLEKDSTLMFRIVLAVIVFIAIGVIFYTLVEGWTVLNSIYFILVTMLSVGYGDFTPNTQGSKVFTTIYAFVSFILMVTAITVIGNWLLDAQEDVVIQGYRRLKNNYRIRRAKIKDSTTAEERMNGISQPLLSHARPEPLPFPWPSFVFPFTLYCIGALVFAFLEKWNFVDAIYFSMITLCTIGYGDITAKTVGGRIFCIFYLLFGCISLGKLAKDLLEWHRSTQQSKLLDFIVNSYKGEDELTGMDLDGDGRIDKVEWLTHVLTSSESIEKSVIMTILARFEEMDTDKDGYVMVEDVQEYHKMRRSIIKDAGHVLQRKVRRYNDEEVGSGDVGEEASPTATDNNTHGNSPSDHHNQSAPPTQSNSHTNNKYVELDSESLHMPKTSRDSLPIPETSRQSLQLSRPDNPDDL